MKSFDRFVLKKIRILLIKIKGISKSFSYRHLKKSSFSATCFQAFLLHSCPCTPSCSCHKGKGILAQLLKVDRFLQVKDLQV